MSKVLIAAIPKSGNNMMQKACNLLGVEAEYEHTTNYHLADTRKCIYVYRNPRNVLISALRLEIISVEVLAQRLQKKS